MVEFITLFIGLVTGPQMLEVAVTEDVARVELRLDGATRATVDGAPEVGALRRRLPRAAHPPDDRRLGLAGRLRLRLPQRRLLLALLPRALRQVALGLAPPADELSRRSGS